MTKKLVRARFRKTNIVQPQAYVGPKRHRRRLFGLPFVPQDVAVQDWLLVMLHDRKGRNGEICETAATRTTG